MTVVIEGSAGVTTNSGAGAAGVVIVEEFY
jgi:hypothetical protein